MKSSVLDRIEMINILCDKGLPLHVLEQYTDMTLAKIIDGGDFEIQVKKPSRVLTDNTDELAMRERNNKGNERLISFQDLGGMHRIAAALTKNKDNSPC